jgi:uncharacterized iron-regulated membrane protein
MTPRTILFWLHLSAGAVAGLVILIMSVTGVLLTYERQMAEWADLRSSPIVRPARGAQRLPIDTIVQRVAEREEGAQLGTVSVRAGEAPVTVTSGSRTLFVNPYTGDVIGEGAPGVRAFFRRVRDWHRWLAVSGDGRAAARAVTGASNLAFLFIVVSGFYLWWPRNRSWRQIRQVVWFRGGLSARARDFNWHNTVGFWCSVPLFIVVLSATVISYRWSSDLVYRLAGEDPPPAAAPRPANAPSPRGRATGLDSLVRIAGARVPDWRSVSFRIPDAGSRTAAVTIDRGTGGEPQKRATMTVDLARGQETGWQPFSSQSRGRRWRSWLRFAHTGEAGGLAGQTIAGVASAGGALLVWTGIGMAIRRFNSWRGVKSRITERAA